MGNGKRIVFWEDSWVGSSPLSSSFPDIYPVSLRKEAMVPDSWCEEQQTQDLGLRKGLFHRIRKLEQPNPGLNSAKTNVKSDEVKWKLEPSSSCQRSLLSLD